MTVRADLRPLLHALAYRMLGSVSEAEDVVQEAFLRYERATRDGVRVENPKAWLTAVATRLAMDQLRSARVRREEYVGPWLPEPLVDPSPPPAEQVEVSDSLSMAFLVVLETLSPVERAVFLLREVFDYEFAEVAEIVGRTEVNCRQILVRARRRVDERKPRFDVSREHREELARRFFAAFGEGDTGELVEILAADVVFYGDGGGRTAAIPQPLHGRERVARMLGSLARQAATLPVRAEPAVVNGQPGAIFRDPDGRIINVVALDVADGAIQAVRSVVNPEKLGHLGPVADVNALLRSRRERRR